MISTEKLIASAPDNFVIRDALIKCAEVVDSHDNIFCSVSGGADSDVMLDMLIRCGAAEKTRFAFFNTGVEYRATLEHLNDLEEKYGIQIERINAIKSIPTCVREFGVPFISKSVSADINSLQRHGFRWEDEPLEVLKKRYSDCTSSLKWWCNYQPEGVSSTQFIIKRNRLLKEFMIENPPTFMISDRCCSYAKKLVSKRYERANHFDLKCMGIRKSEGGQRATAYHNCFSEGEKLDHFRPVFWFRDQDKEAYCAHYGVTHSRCYSQYGVKRTGCVGCPYSLHLFDDLAGLKQYEPELYRLATTVFRDSYEYTQKYREYRKQHS